MTKGKSAILGALVLATPLARAELVDVRWDAAGRFEHRAAIAAGKFVEVCTRLNGGARVDWRFTASAPTNFNVHYHEGKEVRFPAKEDGIRKSSGILNAQLDQDYCWMWSNKSDGELNIAIDLRKE